MNPTTTAVSDSAGPFALLERSVEAALESYSNVHRGAGHHSMATTHLYEKARDIVLGYLGLALARHTVVFCSPYRAGLLVSRLKPDSYKSITSQEIGLPAGVAALAIRRNALPGGTPFQTGGGNARLISREWVIWARGAERYEAGTPAIINVIAFAQALRLRRSGKGDFSVVTDERQAPADILYRDELDGYAGRELLGHLRETLIGRGKAVPTAEEGKPFINMDFSASTPTFGPVWNTVCQTWRQPAEVQQEIVREVRSVCAEFLEAPSADYDIVFTSNTTEAINLAAGSMARESGGAYEPVVLNTLIEHSSNDLPWRLNSGAELIRLAADQDGLVDLQELDRLLSAYNVEELYGKKRVRMVSVTGASNVLGSFNDLAKISRIVHHYGARLFVDAAQLAAHREVRMEEWGIDGLAFSAHKVYAPFGTGVLAIRKGLLTFGAEEMARIKASGEENAIGIAALGKALILLRRIGFTVIREEEQALTAYALRGLTGIPGMKVYGISNPDSPAFEQKGGVIVFNLKEIIAHTISRELSVRRGIGIRSGCHCAHLAVKSTLGVSPGLEKFQRIIVTLFPKLSLPGVSRVSFGLTTTEAEIDELIRVLGDIGSKSGIKPDGAPLLKQEEVKKQMKAFTGNAEKVVYGLY
jgi:selenocysteine lyase/cysteine desulfurase